MALTNNQLTDIVEQISDTFSKGLNDYLKREANGFSPMKTAEKAEEFINTLLDTDGERGFVCNSELNELNERWFDLMGGRSAIAQNRVLIKTQKATSSRYGSANYSPEELQQILPVVRTQLTAIAKGFHLVKFSSLNSKQSEKERERPRAQMQAGRGVQPQVVHVHVHEAPRYYYNPYRFSYYGGYGYNSWLWGDVFYAPTPYYYHRYSSFDWGLWELLRLFNNCLELSMMQPSAPRTSDRSRGDSDNDNGCGGAIIAVIAGLLLVGGAVTASLYSINDMRFTISEIIHGERLAGNAIRLGVVSIATWQGVMLGLSIAASCALPPAFGAICMAIIMGGVATAISKAAMSYINSYTNTTSAIANDPRFCLSDTDSHNLMAKNIDPQATSEAIRETAILLKRNKANSLAFWSDQNQERHELIQLMRDLKAGLYPEGLTINGKAFSFELLTPPSYEATEFSPADLPPPAYDAAPGYTPYQEEGDVYRPVKPSAPAFEEASAPAYGW